MTGLPISNSCAGLLGCITKEKTKSFGIDLMRSQPCCTTDSDMQDRQQPRVTWSAAMVHHGQVWDTTNWGFLVQNDDFLVTLHGYLTGELLILVLQLKPPRKADT